MKSFLVLAVLAVLATPAYSCMQLWNGFVTLRGDELRGRVTLNGKPLPDSWLELHRFTASEGSKLPAKARRWKAAPEVLARAMTDRSGQFTLGKVTPGKYVVVMSSPSHEMFTVEVLAADEYSADSRVWIRAYADWCADTLVEPSESNIAAMSN